MNILIINSWGHFEAQEGLWWNWWGFCASFVVCVLGIKLSSTQTVCRCLRMFCVNLRQKTRQKRINPTCPIRNEAVLQRWHHWSKSNAPNCFVLSSLACSHSPSLLHFLLLLLTHPSLPLSEWVALGLLGLVEVYQKHVWRVGGGWWEVLCRVAHPCPPLRKPKLVGKESSQWVLRRKLIRFYRIFFSTKCINRKKLLTLNRSV